MIVINIEMITTDWQAFFSELSDVAAKAEKRVRRFQKIHPFIAAIMKNEKIDIIVRLEKLQKLMDRVMGSGSTSLDSVKFTISELSREFKIVKLRETTQELE